jgi:hypothetical protein
MEDYLERIADSVMLPGEPCEWELTLRSAENVFDGGHDYRRDLMRSHCQHRACAEARAAKETANPDAREERA